MPRPSTIPCACGAEVAVKRDGPIPKRCADCVRVDQIERLLVRLCEGVAGVHAVRVARALDAASKRIKREDMMPYIQPMIPTTPPQKPRCEVCDKPCKEAPMCRRCAARQDTHRRRDDPWARALR